MSTEFHGRSPIEYAVEEIINGSHLSNNTLHFVEVGEAWLGLMKSSSTRFPMVTAELSITGGGDDMLFADLEVHIYNLLPQDGDTPTRAETIRLARDLKARAEMDMVEIVKWLTGYRDPATRQQPWDYMTNGTFSITTERDPLFEPLPDGRAWRIMDTQLVLPLKGGISEIRPDIFRPIGD